MRRTRTLWEVFVLRFEEAMERYRKRRLTAEEAGELLGMSGRHFRRLLGRYEEEGADGLRDRRLGKPSPRRAPPAELTRMQILYQERYRDFTVKHFHEQMQRRHNYTLGYTVTRLALQGAGLVDKQKRRGGPHRKKRQRRPLPGMLLYQDGSTHRWIGALDHDLDLIVTLDDATGAIYSAILVEEEGTMSSFLGLFETIAEQGLFRAFYTDRGSHYFYTPKAGGKVDKSKPTQVGRALAQLGITHIPSYSPEARGRMERVFGTAARRDHHPRGRQPLSEARVRARLQRPLRGAGSRGRLGLHPLHRPGPGGRPVPSGNAPSRSRQLRQLERGRLADPAAAPSPPLRQGNRAGPPIPRRTARHLRRAKLPGAGRPHRKADRRLPSRLIHAAATASKARLARRRAWGFLGMRRSTAMTRSAFQPPAPRSGSRPRATGSRYRSESPTGYSLEGCSPAEPASASPVTAMIAQTQSRHAADI